MALTVTITAPRSGETLSGPQPGFAFTVTGTIGGAAVFGPFGVTVTVDGRSFIAQVSGSTWTCEVRLFSAGQKTLVARGRGFERDRETGRTLPTSALSAPRPFTLAFALATPDLTVTAPVAGPLDLPENGLELVVTAQTADGFGQRMMRWEFEGAATAYAAANPTGSGTQMWCSTVPVSALPLGRRTLTVRCRDEGGNVTTRTVALDARDVTPPTVRVLEPQPDQAFVKGAQPLTVLIRGTAADRQSGMTAGRVEVSLNGAPFRRATTRNAWATWESSVSITEFGPATLVVRGADGAGRLRELPPITIRAINEFRPRTLAERLDSRSYLEALLAFAHQQVRVGTAQLTTAVLQDTFLQPFGRLSQPLPQFGDAGNRPINQLRAVAEVLRRLVTAGGPAELEAGYRQRAYAALLAGIGTGDAELRLMRGADPAVRRALADRLGITLGTTAPDELDRLTLTAESLTEERLEELFGLRDTAASKDPLRPLGAPLVLQWREAHLAGAWARQDHAPEAVSRSFVVLVDPDLVDPGDLAPTGAAAALLTARRQEVERIAADLDVLRRGAGTPRQAFDAQIADTFLAADTIATIDAQRREGQDIAPRLRELFLTREAFDQLVRISGLAGGGTVTEAEWRDVRDILTQVKKIRRFAAWRAEENAITLSPEHFRIAALDPALPRWRASRQARDDWQHLLRSRIADRRALQEEFQTMVAAAEELALPDLRDALVAAAPGAAEELTERLQIDVKAAGALRVTAILQAIETLQSVLFSVRTGRIPAGHPAFSWTVDEVLFDAGWKWLGSAESWRAAMLAFLYPENTATPAAWPASRATPGFGQLLDATRKLPQLTAGEAAKQAGFYYDRLTTAQKEALGAGFQLKEPRTPADFARLRDLSRGLLAADRANPPWVVETFFLVPVHLALRLAASGEYVAALDWFQAVYAHNLPPARREIYHGLVLELPRPAGLTPPADWLSRLNPHTIAGLRPNPYTRFTLINLARSCLEFADAEFTRDTIESVGHARGLYVTAREMLASPELEPVPQTDPTAEAEFLNPVVIALRARVETQLSKLRQGRNIAGMKRTVPLPADSDGAAAVSVVALPPRMPTPYPYKVLVERSKQLLALSQQIEAEYLAALEKFDQAAYRRFEADKGLDLAVQGVTLQDLRVREADRGITLAQAQRDRAGFLADSYARRINAGLNEHETAMLDGYQSIRNLRQIVTGLDTTIAIAQQAAQASSWASFITSFGFQQVANTIAVGAIAAKGVTAGFLNDAEARLQSDTFWAAHERQVEEWRLNQGLAQRDIAIAAEQVRQARDERAVVGQELRIAQITADQARATVEFLDRQFTNAELYEWMSGVLGGIFRYFLQTATAMARLAQDQLAFERQEPAPGLIGLDYWQLSAERRGITGSARLLQDLQQLDQYAFQTDRRKLNLSQTFSLAERAPLEFQLFQQTGMLRFATPSQWFDDDFPGHHLRLIKRVRVSVVGLIPPSRGIRATLTASGISRVVARAGQTLRELVIRRDPELVAFTSPVAATGVFELDSQPEMLLPFEAMGVDTEWELQLPRPANPFDFGSLADVLVTIEYTALHSEDYRQQVLARPGAARRSGDRPFSLRRDFPDQWYELHNPDPDDTTRTVRLGLEGADFPAALRGLQVEQIVLFLDAPGDPVPPTLVTLRHAREGGEAQSYNGVISTRRGNAASWSQVRGQSPFGEWELEFAPGAAELFDEGELTDIVLVIGYSGRLPSWPA